MNASNSTITNLPSIASTATATQDYTSSSTIKGLIFYDKNNNTDRIKTDALKNPQALEYFVERLQDFQLNIKDCQRTLHKERKNLNSLLENYNNFFKHNKQLILKKIQEVSINKVKSENIKHTETSVSTDSILSRSVSVKFDIDDDGKIKRKENLRKATRTSSRFNASTQTIETGADLTPIQPNWLKKFKSLSIGSSTSIYGSDTNPAVLAQPFIGFIRKHEKIYARENGLMRIALREFKRVYENIQFEIEDIVQNHSRFLHIGIGEKLNHVLFKMQDNNWLFDPAYFVQKVSMNPLEDPIDVAAQTKLISSYMIVHGEVEKNLESISSTNGEEGVEEQESMKEVHVELGRLLTDLSNRRKRSGGWRSMLYNTDGSMDLEMDIEGFDAKDKIEILHEKLRYVQVKNKEKERQQNQTIHMQKDVIMELQQEINNMKINNSNNNSPGNSHPIDPGRKPSRRSIMDGYRPKKHSSPTITPTSSVDNLPVEESTHSLSSVLKTQPTALSPSNKRSNELINKDAVAIIKNYEDHLHLVLNTLHMVYSTLVEKNRKLEEQNQTSSSPGRNKIHREDTVDSGINAEDSFYSSSSVAILDSYRDGINTKTALPSSKQRAASASVYQTSKVNKTLKNSLEKKISNALNNSKDDREYIVLTDSKRPLSSISTLNNNTPLRISKGLNSPIDYKHLLARPQTANPIAIATANKSAKGFASIVAKSMSGNKPPLDAYRLIETQNRQERAKQQIAIQIDQQHNNSNKFQGGLLPNHPSSDYAAVLSKNIDDELRGDIITHTFSAPNVNIPEIATIVPDKIILSDDIDINCFEDLNTNQDTINMPISNDAKFYTSSHSLIRDVSEMCQRLVDDFALHYHPVATTTSVSAIPSNISYSGQAAQPFPSMAMIGIGEALFDQETSSQASSQHLPHSAMIPPNHNKYGSVYETLFANININSRVNYSSKSDVNNYLSITKDKLDHYKIEVKKMEKILKTIGSIRSNESFTNHSKNLANFSDIQDIANNHYANVNTFRPQSAATPTVAKAISVQSIHINHPPRAKTATPTSTNRNTNKVRTGSVTTGVSFSDSRFSDDDTMNHRQRTDDDTVLTNFNQVEQKSVELSNLSEYEVV